MSKKKSPLAGLSVIPETKEKQSAFAGMTGKEPMVRFNANVPASLNKKLKQHCLDNDITATAWLIEQLERL